MTMTNTAIQILKTLCHDRMKNIAHIQLHGSSHGELTNAQIDELDDQFIVLEHALEELKRIEA